MCKAFYKSVAKKYPKTTLAQCLLKMVFAATFLSCLLLVLELPALARAHDVGSTKVHINVRRGVKEKEPGAAVAPFLPAPTLAHALYTVPKSVRYMTADAAILMDAKTGEVLYEKNGKKREYPASMTKIMTCILSLESGRSDLAVTITDFAADVEATRVDVGLQARLKDLTRQMMLISDNGAALAIAETLGGSEENFAAMMNAKAKEIGAFSTHFVNPNGMPDKDHYSTAYDIALIAAYGLKNPEFRKIVATKDSTIYYLKPLGYTIYCENTNDLLYDYPGCTGLKTGWTSAAGACLAASARRGDKELIAVVMHADDEDARAKEAAALLDYGFYAFGS